MYAISESAQADTLLDALAEQVSARGQSYTVAVVGGAALLALGLVSRATRDVDIVALVEDGVLTSAEPLPAPLAESARIVARDFGLAEGWLNAGPTSLLDFGLPEGFYARAHRRDFGDALRVLLASRVDQIHLKLYAVVDQSAGKHLNDLRALNPTSDELLAAARWSRTHDPSEGYRDGLVRVLAHFGADDGSLGP